MKKAILVTALLAGISCLNADVLELNDGKILRGTYQGGTDGTIRFEANGKSEVYPASSVAALSIEPGGSKSSSQAASNTAVQQHTIPAGSQVVVELRSEVSTVSARPGQKFDAILQNDLRSGSVVIAPRGSLVTGTVTEVQRPRRVSKAATLAVTLDSVNVGGQSIRLNTNTKRAETHNDGAAIRGALAGAIVGEIVDNDAGKGAAAGATMGALKRGDNIGYAPGTIMKFSLSTPLTVSK
ncbi:hypothetical protein [Pelagicoccus mobilis]|uniref:DUF5666 domain-containing protein n=1 Tax=Pelagicoccus mobilis TaxID=415221 RepID=A0A934RWF3_9BACT|nr:hypothetical protein [Pelagicoccus mobilis]MBK1877603.1 hypothetical protein [Pelagicoccus mobilis]